MYDIILLCLPQLRYRIFFRVAKAFSRKDSCSNPVVGMLKPERIHNTDNATSSVDGYMDEGVNILKMHHTADLFEAFQNLCKYSTPATPSKKQLKISMLC